VRNAGDLLRGVHNQRNTGTATDGTLRVRSVAFNLGRPGPPGTKRRGRLDGHRVRSGRSAPLRGLQVRLEILVNGQVADSFGILQPRTISTGSDGRALATYTAPPSSNGLSGTVDLVTIRASTVGTNYQLSKSQVVDIRLVAPIVTTPGAPIAFFTYAPTSAITTSTLVAFNGSGSYPVNGSRIMNYAWDWGDGTTDDFNSSPTEDHDWIAAGVYAVTLTVTDDLGQRASATQLITVG